MEIVSMDDLRVLRVKLIYENLIRSRIGKYVRFDVSKATNRGRTSYNRFLWISKKCDELGVSVSDFLGVLFRTPAGGGSWAYPYLSFVASERAVKIFEYRRGVIERSFLGNRSGIRSASSDSDFEVFFINCFVSGVRLLSSLPDDYVATLEQSLEELFSFFLAFPEVFTAEFVASHSKVESFLNGEDSEVRQAVVTFVSGVRKRLADPFYRERFWKSRKKVMDYEYGLVVRTVNNVERLWKILV